jgi:hypothetical protein
VSSPLWRRRRRAQTTLAALVPLEAAAHRDPPVRAATRRGRALAAVYQAPADETAALVRMAHEDRLKGWWQSSALLRHFQAMVGWSRRPPRSALQFRCGQRPVLALPLGLSHHAGAKDAGAYAAAVSASYGSITGGGAA